MKQAKSSEKMRAILLHLGSNMWSKPSEKKIYSTDPMPYYETMHCDREVWRKVTDFLPECGINTVVIDIGEGVRLDSHPEIAVPGAWEKSELKAELQRLRSIGLAPIPKFNFSCAHNAWMQEYGYMASTPEYRQFCRDIIAETIELFDKPEFFHLGLNDENVSNQEFFPVAVVRCVQSFIDDVNVMFDTCREYGVRPWIWADLSVIFSFGGEESFKNNVPKDVLLSNLYGGNFSDEFPPVDPEHQHLSKMRMPPALIYRNSEKINLYRKFNEWGYEQVPTGTTHDGLSDNMSSTMAYCESHLKNQDTIRGYMATPWLQTDIDGLYGIMYEACKLQAAADNIKEG